VEKLCVPPTPHVAVRGTRDGEDPDFLPRVQQAPASRSPQRLPDPLVQQAPASRSTQRLQDFRGLLNKSHGRKFSRIQESGKTVAFYREHPRIFAQEMLVFLKSCCTAYRGSIVLKCSPLQRDRSIYWYVGDMQLTDKSGKTSFRSQMNGDSAVYTFPSRSGAMLVVPECKRDATNHAHLSVFTQTAPRELSCELWETVIKTASDGQYISTHGAAVPWLHVRITDDPMYY
jgi:hypothetical protein